MTHEKDGHIATIMLDRPDRLNSIGDPRLRSSSHARVDTDREPVFTGR